MRRGSVFDGSKTTEISFVQYGALTGEQWKQYAVCEIKTPSNRGSNEVHETPYDPRLGVLERRMKCPTCGEENMTCPGHFGYIRLEEPVINPNFIKIIYSILQSICVICCEPKISENLAKIQGLLSSSGESRLNAYKKKAKLISFCKSCSNPIPKFYLEGSFIKYYLDDKSGAKILTGRKCLSILTKLTDEVMTMLGFNSNLSPNPKFIDPETGKHVHALAPEAMVFTHFPVTPINTRPWIAKGSDRKDDDITDRYNMLLKINAKLRAHKEAPLNDASPIKGRRRSSILSDLEYEKATMDLTLNIYSLFDNSKEQNKNFNRTFKGISQRLSGKQGQLNLNGSAKRSDFTARTVIVSGGTLVPMGSTGVSDKMCTVLSQPELVLGWNIRYFQRLLREGKINTVIRKNPKTGAQQTIDVALLTDNFTKPFVHMGVKGLRLMDFVNRQLLNGDIGNINRQPTLRIESIQGMRIVPMKNEYVLRLPVGHTRPFNADGQ